MQGELRESQTTSVPGGKGKGKERKVVVFSDVEELDGPLSPKASSSGKAPARNTGLLTPVDPPLRVGSAIIATDQVMEVDIRKKSNALWAL